MAPRYTAKRARLDLQEHESPPQVLDAGLSIRTIKVPVLFRMCFAWLQTNAYMLCFSTQHSMLLATAHCCFPVISAPEVECGNINHCNFMCALIVLLSDLRWCVFACASARALNA